MAHIEHKRIAWQTHLSKIPNANLQGFDLSKLAISSANLVGANLSHALLQKADLSGAYLKNGILIGANLRRARLILADLREVDLSKADLTACDLDSSVLTNVKLCNANLTKASLVRAHLAHADFSGANLKGADMRGAKGITKAQLKSAVNSDKAILDEHLMVALGRTGATEIARHGRKPRKVKNPHIEDLVFKNEKPRFGDIYRMCGEDHPDFPPSGALDFSPLRILGIEQLDDYFAICKDGDPIIWIFPMVNGDVVAHHPGPFDGIRIELANGRYKKRWHSCIARFRSTIEPRRVE